MLSVLAVLALASGARGDTVTVSPNGPVRSIGQGIELARPGGTVLVRAGVYREPTIIVRKSVRIQGDSGAVLDGGGANAILVIAADFVTVRGLTFQNTGTSYVEDRAAVRVMEATSCTIIDNSFTDTFFAVYLQRVSSCEVARNRMTGLRGTQSGTGNGVHAWQSRDIVIRDNEITGHRDGIYFEFVSHGTATGNLVQRSLRYGLHFMFSDSCVYERNTFASNEAGVAVMYASAVRIVDNDFVRNRGSAAYGLLLKDINGSVIAGNAFIDNTVALHLEGSNRNRIEDNVFRANGWAVRLLANADDNLLAGNAFEQNLFDVSTNSRRSTSTVRGNYWDRYRGYDLDRDGSGDVPHAPVRLFALIVERAPAALLLVRSVIADALDLAERVAPVLTPASLSDTAPLMRPPLRSSR